MAKQKLRFMQAAVYRMFLRNFDVDYTLRKKTDRDITSMNIFSASLPEALNNIISYPNRLLLDPLLLF
jgi:hypothetical protein